MSNPTYTKGLDAVLERMRGEGLFRGCPYNKATDSKGFEQTDKGVSCRLKGGNNRFISYFFWAHTAETIAPEDAPRYLTLIAPISNAMYHFGPTLKVRTLFPEYPQQKKEAPRDFGQFELLALQYHLENLLDTATDTDTKEEAPLPL